MSSNWGSLGCVPSPLFALLYPLYVRFFYHSLECTGCALCKCVCFLLESAISASLKRFTNQKDATPVSPFCKDNVLEVVTWARFLTSGGWEALCLEPPFPLSSTTCTSRSPQMAGQRIEAGSRTMTRCSSSGLSPRNFQHFITVLSTCLAMLVCQCTAQTDSGNTFILYELTASLWLVALVYEHVCGGMFANFTFNWLSMLSGLRRPRL